MEIATLILEYVKVMFSAPVMFAFVAVVFILMFRQDIKALTLRIAKIRLPGGTEVSVSQSDQLAAELETPSPAPIVNDQVAIVGLPTDLTPPQRIAIEQLIRAHIATSYIWEYRYLTYYLVRNTLNVLDWLISLSQPTTYAFFESVWIQIIPSANERQAIISALHAHHLIQVTSEMIEVTPKGREFANWRSKLPSVISE